MYCTGVIQRVGREEMERTVVTNPLQAIKGKVAGVNIYKKQEVAYRFYGCEEPLRIGR